METPLILAVPSKGRLREDANVFLARAGMELVQSGGARHYRGGIKGVDEVEIVLLSAGEIARELAAGTVHLGVTGRDLVEETIGDWDERVQLVTPLGFGFADVVVAVPQAWIDVETMADLDDVAADFRRRHGRRLKVATKYFNLTRRFFAGHGIADYRIVESLGATEGTPASGAADLIVDITSTGSTLDANGLKRLGDGKILTSEAHLVASLNASWSDLAKRGLSIIRDRIGAEALANKVSEIRADVDEPEMIAAEAARRFKAGIISAGTPGGLILHCRKEVVEACADWLRLEAGARRVTDRRPETILDAAGPAFDRLIKKIEKHS